MIFYENGGKIGETFIRIPPEKCCNFIIQFLVLNNNLLNIKSWKHYMKQSLLKAQ